MKRIDLSPDLEEIVGLAFQSLHSGGGRWAERGKSGTEGSHHQPPQSPALNLGSPHTSPDPGILSSCRDHQRHLDFS